jgi:hypothetical protein
VRRLTTPKIPRYYALTGITIVRRFRGYQIEGSFDPKRKLWDLVVNGPDNFRGLVYGLDGQDLDAMGRDMVNNHITVERRAQQVRALRQLPPLDASES